MLDQGQEFGGKWYFPSGERKERLENVSTVHRW